MEKKVLLRVHAYQKTLLPFINTQKNKDINLSLIKKAIDVNNSIRQKYNIDERKEIKKINFKIHKDS